MDPEPASASLPGPVLADLLRAREYLTPAIALCLELDRTGLTQPGDVVRHRGRIEAAISRTQQDMRESDEALRALVLSAAVPAGSVPEGF